ncbi:MAG: dihydrolipoyl dehydrogenase family protein, partial [Calditrichota bacterium]
MKYDVTIIGSGPGGYVAAIRCAQLGMKTALIEKYSTLGGTCLNVGCIPSKALLDSSELYYNAKMRYAAHGINVHGLDINWPQMMSRKEKVIADTVAGIKYLMGKNKIDVYEGIGSFVNSGVVAVTKPDGREERLETAKVVIATGSKPATLPFITLDKRRVITSTEALSLDKIPGEMIIIGGGAIGLEMGSVYARLGTKVEVIEFMDSIIPTMDRTMGKELQRSLQKIGMNFYLSHRVQSVKVNGNRVEVSAQNKAGDTVTFSADKCLVAVGRRPYSENLRLENTGVTVDQRGFIQVNEHLETRQPGIYAIGDVIGGAMLAHKAEEEGMYV